MPEIVEAKSAFPIRGDHSCFDGSRPEVIGDKHVGIASPQNPGGAAFALGFIAVALALVTGWLGGELVDRLGVGVDSGAHLDAPSSLSGRPAREQGSQRDIRRIA